MPEVGFKPTVSESKQSRPMPQTVQPLVPAENHMKPINTKCRITDFVTGGGTYTYHWALKGLSSTMKNICYLEH
jgi:hypothetical protein